MTRFFGFFVRTILLILVMVIACSSGILAQKTFHFKPSKYYYTYDAGHEPVLKLKPGDILVTTTRDAFSNKISREDQKASDMIHMPEVNDQTGPFFVEGAEPGDTLVLHLIKVIPDRDYAVSTHIPHFGALSGETYTSMLNDPLPEKTYIL